MTWSDVLVLVRKFREKQLTPTLNSEDSGAVKSAKSDKILSGPSSPQIKVGSFFYFYTGCSKIICFALSLSLYTDPSIILEQCVFEQVL